MKLLDPAAELNNIGCALMEQGNFLRARRFFERAGDHGAGNLLCCLMRLGALDEALTAFERGEARSLGHSDTAGCWFAAVLCARGMPTAAARVAISLLGNAVAYSDDQSRGQLGMMAVIASALAGGRHAERLRRVSTLTRKRGARAVYLGAILKASFWEGKDDPRLEARIVKTDARTRWEWGAILAIRSRLLGREPGVEALVGAPYAWTKPLTALLVRQAAGCPKSKTRRRGTRKEPGE